MTIPKRIRDQMLEFCGSISEEDGQDPRRTKTGNARPANANHSHRRLRLCRQIMETLSLVLPGASDPVVCSLVVDGVEPASRGPSIKVRVRSESHVSIEERRESLGRLRAVEGWLRGEIAASTTRRRVPQLVFEWCQDPNTEETQHDA